jgi:integrin beta 1
MTTSIAQHKALAIVTIVVFVLLLIHSTLTISSNPTDTCGKCITSGRDHAWCKMEGFSSDGNRPRCDYKLNLQKAGCLEHEIFRPEAEYYVIDDRPLSNRTSIDEDVVQLRPQRIKLRLPPHVPHTITLQYRQVVDYPVDLYYLMDLSKSMHDDKEKLAQLGNKLATNMKSITSNFRLGFGSFVDKVSMPFVSTVPEKLAHPCPECVAPYGFRNHMPLSTDTLSFTREVKASQTSGNLDAPEGGLDAIMQAIVCQNEVNWREKSRKMLVYTTDASFHYAGDGKLAGIVTPNDGKCHLDSNGLYTESTDQDYPSISQINQKAQEHHVNIIFAATADQVNIYKKLTPLIEGSSAGRLDNDSSNIVDLIEEQYRAISSEIELKDNATSNVQLTYHSSCVNDKRQQTNVCKGLKVGSTVSFDIEVEVKSCPKRASEYNQTIQVYPVGLNEALLIDLEIICDCDCEKPWNIEQHSPKCSGQGDFVCGQCQCDPFKYGKDCRCDSKKIDPANELQGCLRGNDSRVCSGRGECLCGNCICHQKSQLPEDLIYGLYCQCDYLSCPRHEGIICSGPDHGRCDCGTCICSNDWTGPACECPKSPEVCRDPKSGKICAGHGECICGKCNCTQTDERQYSGKYCQDCPACPTLCEQYKDCVRCTIFGTGPKKPEECALQCAKNSTFSIEAVDKLEVLEDETRCVFIDDDDCKYEFKYKLTPFDGGDVSIIHANKNKKCPEPIPFFLILLALALLILLLGLLGLLLWKCLTMWKDRREIAKFEKEKLTAKWDTGENPIFKQATSTFKNPTYKH